MSLPLHEQFYTFQGEGIHSGKAAYFIRLFGCPVHCPWCDSAGTWHPDYIPKTVHRMSPETLADEAAKTNAEFTVITGGEPAIHNLVALTQALHARGQRTHLETSGAFPIKGTFDWITLSPKRWRWPLSENLRQANEFKIIVDSPNATREYIDQINSIAPDLSSHIPIWLNPEWSQHKSPEILNAITEWIKTHGAPYRAGWQQHKNYAADLLDQRSAPPAPLGGRSENGY